MADLGGTLWGIGLLLIPVILAVPVRWLFRSWLGNKAKHTRYREAVRRVLNSGSTLSKFRTALDEEARHLHISEDRQSRIETAMLTPLSIVHFIFIPGVTLSPLITLIAAPVYLLTWPLLTLCERILIKFGFLLRILKFVMSMTDWNVIGIRQHSNRSCPPIHPSATYPCAPRSVRLPDIPLSSTQFHRYHHEHHRIVCHTWIIHDGSHCSSNWTLSILSNCGTKINSTLHFCK